MATSLGQAAPHTPVELPEADPRAERSPRVALEPQRATAVRTHQSPWRPPVWFGRDVLLPFALTRAALTLVGLSVSHDWVAVWANWDAGWYLSIAQHGYNAQNTLNQTNAAFAPALPLLMHLAGLLLGPFASDTSVMLSGLVIVNLALLGALAYLVALVRQEFDHATARRAVVYALVFPSTLFLSAVYPHSLFLLGAIGAMYYARNRQWWLAGGFAVLAALARVQGAIIVVLLAYLYWSQRRRLGRDALALGLPLLAPLGFAGVLWLQIGDPLAMLHAGGAWGRTFSPPWDALFSYVNQPWTAHGDNRSPLDLAFTLLLIGLVGLSWARLRASLALFASVFLLVFLSSGLLVSSMRYGLELFPIFIALAISGRYRLFHYTYLATAAYLALRFMAEAAQGIWVA